MRFVIGVMLSLGFVVPAFAQSGFVPFVVDQAAIQNLQTILNHNVPPDYSTPVIQWVSALEQKALAEEAEKLKASLPKADKK